MTKEIWEAKFFGTAWQAEVCHDPDSESGDKRWKSYEEWEAVYEPKQRQQRQDQSNGGKGQQSSDGQLAKKAKKAILDSVESGIVSKVMGILLEATSRVLGSTEAILRDHGEGFREAVGASVQSDRSEGGGSAKAKDEVSSSSPDPAAKAAAAAEAIAALAILDSSGNGGIDAKAREGAETSFASPDSSSAEATPSVSNDLAAAASFLPTIVNTANAVVLTYRFDQSNPRKCAYLRRIASDGLADSIRRAFDALPAEADRLLELQRQFRGVVESRRDEARDAISKRLDAAIEEAADKIDEKIERDLARAEAEAESAAAIVNGDGILEACGAGEGRRAEIRDALRERKDDLREGMLDMMGKVVKRFVMQEVDTFTVVLAVAVDRILVLVNAAYVGNKQMEGASEKELHEATFEAVERAHLELERRVSKEVRTIVALLGAMMDYQDETDGG